ncbi:acetylcholinesterase-like [Wyeomyia smithii]|uniref:acetylcholinesterase-like n=1 Tax=Wyeomyia smithii TaxID=174621 RepID=UPI002467C68C|nr:acetylcholinesterase-like [Wyeomyia smithii]
METQTFSSVRGPVHATVTNMFEFLRAVYRLVIGTGKYVIQNQLDQCRRCAQVRPIVQVKQGKVRGICKTLPDGSSCYCFKGIPYAKPPIGELRFKPPVPLEEFEVPIIDCCVDGSLCIQPNTFLTFLVVGSEEKALNLSVYSPKLPTKENDAPRLPVMIYIHGGGYISSSASSFMFDPSPLVQEGVIVVIMNYRLGPLGFLCLPSMGIFGNAGLKDQVLAFKWVQENIHNFGGDPKNVTIFGESAGSWSTYLHYLSENSRKYFNRAICQSGVVCTESFFQVDPANKARKLAKALGYRGNSDVGVYETLMNAPAKLIVKHQQDVAIEEEKKLAMNYLFRPVIEPSETEDSIITRSPERILKDFDTIRIPLITGCNSSEGTLAMYHMQRKHQKTAFDKEPQRLVPCFLKENPELNCLEVGREIKKFYFQDDSFSNRTKQQMCDLMSDITFITTTMISAEWLAKHQPSVRHYHYQFTFHGRFSLFKGFSKTSDLKGASHGDDAFYLFDSPLLPTLPDSSRECRVRSHLIRLWTNFAKHDNPTPDHESTGTGSDAPVRWPPVQNMPLDSDEFELDCLDIGNDVAVVRDPQKHRTEFWRNMLKQHRTGLL